MFELVKELTEIPGMSGREEEVQNYLMQAWEPKCRSIKRTGVGNLIAEVGGQGPRLLIDAHADEIGVLVKGFSDEGMIWVAPKNGLAGRPGKDIHLLGHSCIIQTEGGHVEGVFATASGHNIPEELRNKTPIGWNDFFIDIGAKDEREVKQRGVRIGDTVVWMTSTRRLGNYLVGKAMDDRAGLALMTRLLDEIDTAALKYELHFASSVQEEIGLVGAHSLTSEDKFDYCITLDIGLSGDIPLVDPREVNCRLGGGPTIVHHDGTVHYDTTLTRHLIRVAEEHHIKVQHGVFSKYSSNGHALTLSGVPTALIAFPGRYTHSPYEMVCEDDLLQCLELVKAFLTTEFPA